MASYRIRIICEDRYGPEFLKKLIEKLKQQSILSKSLSIDIKRLNPAKCNSKLFRVIKANIEIEDYNKIIIIADADGKDKNKILEKVVQHIPNEYQDKVRIVILDYEIEEWICVSLGIKQSFTSKRPSEILRESYNYEKYKLPHFAEKLDINILTKNCLSFNEFLNGLKM